MSDTILWLPFGAIFLVALVLDLFVFQAHGARHSGQRGSIEEIAGHPHRGSEADAMS